MTVTTEQEYEDAQARIDQIMGGDFSDPGDVAELRELLLAVTRWETAMRPVAGATAAEMICEAKALRPHPEAITGLDEYAAATARAQELTGCAKGSPEEAELAAIGEAIMAWDRRHDDATCWE